MGIVFYLIAALCIFGAGAGSAWKVDEWRHDAKDKAALEAQIVAQAAEDKRTNTISARFEKAIAGLRTNNAATDSRLINELAQAVYTQCVVPASGVVLLDSNADSLNAAAGLAPAAPANPTPAAKPAGPVVDGGSGKGAVDFAAAIRRLRGTTQGAAGNRGGSTGAPK